MLQHAGHTKVSKCQRRGPQTRRCRPTSRAEPEDTLSCPRSSHKGASEGRQAPPPKCRQCAQPRSSFRRKGAPTGRRPGARAAPRGRLWTAPIAGQRSCTTGRSTAGCARVCCQRRPLADERARASRHPFIDRPRHHHTHCRCQHAEGASNRAACVGSPVPRGRKRRRSRVLAGFPLRNRPVKPVVWLRASPLGPRKRRQWLRLVESFPQQFSEPHDSIPSALGGRLSGLKWPRFPDRE